MSKILRHAALAAVAAAACSASSAAPSPQPTVIELFTSQGCSSCPPANATLSVLADRPDLLALSFGVTYWDDLGWKDTFASAQFTARQWDYARSLKHSQVWTPQMVVDGRADTIGGTPAAVEPLIRQARAARITPPPVTLSLDAVFVGSAAAPKTAAQVWLVRYDPRTVRIPIQRGENGGKTLPHRNVVHQLTRLGAWSGSAARFSIPPSADLNLRTAVVVQAGPGGAILAAAKG